MSAALFICTGGYQEMAYDMDVRDVCREYKLGPSWVYSRTRDGGPEWIPHLKLGKYLRFDRVEIQVWIRNKNRRRIEKA
jgi:predicted DNA-binding transcriptional regulator AlpA